MKSVYSINFTHMDTPESQFHYSLKEKFFLIEPEGRIRRYQFLARIMAPWFILLLLFFILVPLFSPQIILLGLSFPQVFLTFTMLLGVAFSYIIYKITYALYTKRCHDFGNDGKLIQKVVLGVFWFQILSALVSILAIYGVDLLPVELMRTIGNFINGISGITYLILLFKKGGTGENQYGKDPINTKIGFFG